MLARDTVSYLPLTHNFIEKKNKTIHKFQNQVHNVRQQMTQLRHTIKRRCVKLFSPHSIIDCVNRGVTHDLPSHILHLHTLPSCSSLPNPSRSTLCSVTISINKTTNIASCVNIILQCIITIDILNLTFGQWTTQHLIYTVYQV